MTEDSATKRGSVKVVTNILMPRLSLTMEKGVVSHWYKKEGDVVKRGEPLLEVDSEKVVYDVEAQTDGVLRKILASEGEEVPVAGVLGIITGADEALPEAAVTPVASKPRRERVLASPAAKRLAREYGVNLEKLKETVKGRITEEAVKRFISRAEAVPRLKESISLTGMQKVAAERVASSYSKTPHCTITMEIDMSNAIEYGRASGFSYTAILTKLVASALTEHPLMNSTFQDDQIKVFSEVNVGVAVATEKGLVVPVVHHANELSLREVSSTLKDLVQKAREGRLVREDLKDGTFTITNLGMFGVDTFTPIINPPEAAILGVGRIVEKPIVVNQEIKIKPTAQLSLSFDHRIVDGAPAARFLRRIKELLEETPMSNN